ncbi:MAG: LCP family protein [Chloroflexi bacterium]|nr:LCP family protein [Chloroflexota bacterium]
MNRNAILIALIGLALVTACGRPPQAAVVEPTATPYRAPVVRITQPTQMPTLPSPSPSKPTAVNVLLLGIDRRGETAGTNNTDTLMLVQIDPAARRVAVLSIPRDLYVGIPGHGTGRINSAYALGMNNGGSGLVLARETVSDTLGLPVHHTMLVDFRAYVAIVDAIGGVDVEVPYDIYDPTYPDQGTGYDPFYISAGEHHLDGETALKYARTRATLSGDFGRTARQRQLVLAIRDRVLRLDMIPGLVTQSPQLWTQLRDSFETDLTLSEIVELGVAASHVPADQIVLAGIDQEHTRPHTTPGGAEVLLPNTERIRELMTEVFGPRTTASTTP